MLLENERLQVLAISKKAKEQGLVSLTFGNFSMRDSLSGLICITPSGLDYEKLQPEDIVIVNINGEVVEGCRKPSVETALHLAIYQRRQDVGAICHTHSPYATAWACCDTDFPVLVAELAAVVGGKIDKVPFFRPGTDELAHATASILQNNYVVLLSNHGLVTLGKDLPQALANALVTEEGAKIAYFANNIGGVQKIKDAECCNTKEWASTKYGQ